MPATNDCDHQPQGSQWGAVVMPPHDIQCSHCGLELRPENALMHEGESFCDEFCRDTEIEERRKKIPFGAGLHRDGTIHIYVKEKDSGLSVGLLEDGTLVVKVDESMRTMIAGKTK